MCINNRFVYYVHVEQLTKTLTLRLTEAEYESLKNEAVNRQRSIGFVAREKIRKAAAN